MISSPEVFIVVWSGGIEAPQYSLTNTLDGARELAAKWWEDTEEGDYIDILRVNTATGLLEKIPTRSSASASGS